MQKEWINTDIEEIETPNLSMYGFKNYSVSLSISGCGSSGRCNNSILELSRYHYLHDGIFNEQRQCYYPRDRTTNIGTAEYNKLEKLFKKWDFSSLA